MKIFAYDFDGVVSIGIVPRKNDIIITGRCFDEKDIVLKYLKDNNIENKIFFNQISLKERGNHSIKSRTLSGQHKATTINNLKQQGIFVTRFFDDDNIQIKIIQQAHPEIELVHIVSNLVEK